MVRCVDRVVRNRVQKSWRTRQRASKVGLLMEFDHCIAEEVARVIPECDFQAMKSSVLTEVYAEFG